MDELATNELGSIARSVSTARNFLAVLADRLHIFLQGLAAYGPGPDRLIDAKEELGRICGELEDIARDISPP
jgi:hypothetical protein